MAGNEHMRTGQLIIRRHAPLRRSLVLVLLVVVGAVLLYGMYEWGRYEAGHNQVAVLLERRQLAAHAESLEQENIELRSRIAAVDTSRDVDRKSYADVERTLGELQAQVLRQSEELAFYRGIVAPADGIGGLRIQRFTVQPGGSDRHFRLRLVLVQALRQDALISGTVNVEIEGSLNQVPTRLPLSEATSEEQPVDRLPFSFRYFQNVEHDVMLPEGFEPLSINVEVRSARQPAVRQSFPWQIDPAG